MFRAALRPGFAWLLLLCLGRTLLPEAWLLTWHPHRHTTEEPVVAARRGQTPQHWLGTRHQHCHAEQFYDVPFTGPALLVLAAPRQRVLYAARTQTPGARQQPARESRPTLRGPPPTLAA